MPPETRFGVVYKAMRISEKSRTDVAKILDCDEKEVRRLLNPCHSSRLPSIESA